MYYSGPKYNFPIDKLCVQLLASLPDWHDTISLSQIIIPRLNIVWIVYLP